MTSVLGACCQVFTKAKGSWRYRLQSNKFTSGVRGINIMTLCKRIWTILERRVNGYWLCNTVAFQRKQVYDTGYGPKLFELTDKV